MPVTREGLLHFLSAELAVDAADITPHTPLFSSGLVDSFAFVTLLSHIESEAGFLIEPSDVNLDNFDSIERILAYVERIGASTT
jgi:acyl carrier protein